MNMTKTKDKVSVLRNYHDTVFRKLFRSKKELLSLYNAVNGTHYGNPDDLEIVTLDNAIYMSMKNDLAFLIDFQLHLYEHQSSVNPNMPLRLLHYVSQEYEKLLEGHLLYRNKLVKIPAPHFVVFYNGTAKQQELLVQKLSDAFMQKENDPQLELKVKVININTGSNRKLMEQCRTLKEYMLYIDRVRSYIPAQGIEAAVARAVDECIKEGILAEFLRQNKAEVIAMSIYEYDEEKVLAMIRRDEREDGITEGLLLGEMKGKIDSILELLSDLGTLPEAVEQKIRVEKDATILNKWLKLAARSESIAEFIEHMTP